MTAVRLKYVHAFVDRHGHARHYFRFRGMRWPLPAPGAPGFMMAYETRLAHAQKLAAEVPQRELAFLPGSLGWVIEKFLGSQEYAARAAGTKIGYRRVLDDLRRRYGPAMLTTLTDRNVKQIRNDLRETFSTSTADLGTGLLSTLWEFADQNFDLDLGANPTHGIRRIHQAKGEREPWPAELIAQFEATASTQLRLALRLLLYTGQRRSDVVKMKWTQYDGAAIEVRQQKTGQPLIIPCHRLLREALEAAPRRHEYILLMERGRGPYDGPGLGRAVRNVLRRFGVWGYSVHGLRKNAGVAMAEAGCTIHEIMAVLGHQSHGMAMHYSKRANQRRSAESAMEKWENAGASGNPRNRAGAK